MRRTNCYACEAAVLPDMESCAACGAALTDAAEGAYGAVREAQASVDQWKTWSIVFVVLAFALGTGFGMWMRGTQVERTTYSPQPGAAVADMPIERANDVFMRTINDELHLGLTGWVRDDEGRLVLEMARPGPQNEAALWERFSPEERGQVIGFLGVTYSRTLVAAGYPLNVRDGGHPPLVLKYREIDAPLAVRERSGELAVYPSPFERARAPQRRPEGG